MAGLQLRQKPAAYIGAISDEELFQILILGDDLYDVIGSIGVDRELGDRGLYHLREPWEHQAAHTLVKLGRLLLEQVHLYTRRALTAKGTE